MKQSHLFTKTRKEAPSDEVSKNAQLLIRAGYIHKEMAGVYSFLPLGLHVITNIATIIREEMNALGGVEIQMTTLQDREVWEKSGRWNDEIVDNWFKTKLKNGGEVGLGFTHEEPLTRIVSEHVNSYKDLPKYIYQIQTKFRNESRAKSGILRGREFLMKDLYSFCRDEAEHTAFYEKSKVAYRKIFDRVGLGEKTYLTFASGGTFCKYSHEFQTLTVSGEDTIHLCEKCHIAVNEEIIKEVVSCPECNGALSKTEKAVEVGNIFSLGTKYASALGLQFTDEQGVKKTPVMGSYGIGIGRVMGTIVEVFADEKGIVWPESVAPFRVHLVAIAGADGANVMGEAEKLYNGLSSRGVSVLFDDRDLRAGEKFADADLLGIPTRIVISEKTISGGKLEVKDRKTGVVEMHSEEDFFKKCLT